ncbi:MAG: hypothetical protein AB7O26_12345, partial [Planctomycetaceae bacterium]
GCVPPLSTAVRAETPESDATLKAVLLAPTRPVFLRFELRVDNEGLETYRARFSNSWFSQLDRNKDGAIDEKESEASLEKGDGDKPVEAVKDNWKRIDTSPADGKATPDEFRQYVDGRIGSSIAFDDPKPKNLGTKQLFDILDSNHDGALTSEELKAARAALARLDADNDETVSEEELEADAENRKLGTGDSAPRLKSLVIVGANATPELLAEELVRKYDGMQGTARDNRLDFHELGLSPNTLAPHDGNADGGLDISEITKFIGTAVPEAELTIHLFERERSRPVAAAKIADATSNLKSTQASSDSANLELSGFQMNFTAKRTRGATGDRSSFFTVRFRIVDRDKNNYLDAKEFESLGLPEADFASVDADSDKQIVLAEVTNFLGRQGVTPMNQVLLSVSDESRSLFDVLDTRADRRLSPRELNSAVAVLLSVDGDKDGRITFSELTTRVNVSAEVKRPATERNMAMMMPQQRTGGTSVSRDAGPEWFQRMDRNFDGDVSWKEFLGPRAAFDRLDSDRDGLLSPSEAEPEKPAAVKSEPAN